MALSLVEQRHPAVMAVLDGASVVEVARDVWGVAGADAWIGRYRAQGLAGLCVS